MSEVISSDIKRIKSIKLIAKWFLLLQSLSIIGWILSVHYCMEEIFTAHGWMTGFAIAFIYIIAFCILTISVVFKKTASLSIKGAVIKLIVVFICVIVPLIVLSVSFAVF